MVESAGGLTGCCSASLLNQPAGGQAVECYVHLHQNIQPSKPSTLKSSQYTLRVDEGRRDEIVAAMKEEGIPVGVYYPKCFHEQPVFRHLGYTYGDFSESEKASREVLSLPMHPFLSIDEQQEITTKLIELL